MRTYSSWLSLSIPLLLLALVSASEIVGHSFQQEHRDAAVGKRAVQEESDQAIVGGDIALGEEYPFFALLYRSQNDFSYVCGGTLIAPGNF